jgi:hypothetical protein
VVRKCGEILQKNRNETVRQHVATFRHALWGILIELRRITCEFAQHKDVNYNFKHKIKLARKDWAQSFLRRNRELSVRKPEPTTFSRILAFNKIDVTRIDNNLVAVSEMCKFGLNHIFTVVESGFSCLQKPA